MTFRNILENPSFVKPELRRLEKLFVEAGYELVFVGGCVRDALLGKEPKDVDLATSATPEEQIALYEANDIRFIETGLQHGTVTAVLDGEPYEITTYRIDKETDGRRAKVDYTRDLAEDLSRRDLTFNAIAMRFDGTLVDPFGGMDDLEKGQVRFVGNAQQRIEEDYLRILRFFRFFGRFGSGEPDRDAIKAIKRSVDGLNRISVERIWMEMAKIISGPQATEVAFYMREAGVLKAIAMPEGPIIALTGAQRFGVTNPASIMGWFVSDANSVDVTAKVWKWSSDEQKRASFVASVRKKLFSGSDPSLAFFKRFLVDGVPFEWVADTMRLVGFDPEELADWEVPVMPVTGNDLKEAGMKPGPEMGKTLGLLKEKWAESNYSLDKNSLMLFLP